MKGATQYYSYGHYQVTSIFLQNPTLYTRQQPEGTRAHIWHVDLK